MVFLEMIKKKQNNNNKQKPSLQSFPNCYCLQLLGACAMKINFSFSDELLCCRLRYIKAYVSNAHENELEKCKYLS